MPDPRPEIFTCGSPRSATSTCLFCPFSTASHAEMDGHYHTVHSIRNTDIGGRVRDCGSFAACHYTIPTGGHSNVTYGLPPPTSAEAAAAAATPPPPQPPPPALSLAWLHLLLSRTAASGLLQQLPETAPLPLAATAAAVAATASRTPPRLSPASPPRSNGFAATSGAVPGRNVEGLARKVWSLGGTLNCLPGSHYSATCRRCGREVKLTERKVQKFKLHIQSCYRKLLRASARAAAAAATATTVTAAAVADDTGGSSRLPDDGIQGSK